MGSTNDCPATGVKYLPKSGGSTPPTTTTTGGGSSPTGGGGAFIGKGFLEVTSGGKADGCIISAGTWYTSGTCATFTGNASGISPAGLYANMPSTNGSTSGSGFTLTSSKGSCAIVSGALTCGSSVSSPTVFTVSQRPFHHQTSCRLYPADDVTSQNVGGNLAASGSSTFYASAVASGSTQETVYTGSHATSLTIGWSAQ